MSNRNRPTPYVNDPFDWELIDEGKYPESAVAEWWDKLDASERQAHASACGADYDELGDWETLNPIGQQMRLHMYRNGDLVPFDDPAANDDDFRSH